MIKPLITADDLELIFEALLCTDLEEGDPADKLFTKIDDNGYVPLYAIPEGYALVPLEPTQAMLDAGLDSIDSQTHRLNRMRKYYKAMIKAGGVK